MGTDSQWYCITPTNEVTSDEELRRELSRLFESAYRNDVPLGTVSTWVCRYERIPDREIVVTEITKPQDGS